jgi:hypothetical protein
MNLSTYITPEMKLWAFRAYLLLRQFSISAWYFGSAVVSTTYAALQPNDYVFFDGYEMPLQAWKVNTESPGVPRPYWYYNPSKNLFFKTSPTGELHRLPFLSATLSFNSMNLYQLDEFFGEQQYVGEQPPPLVLIGAWCVANGIVLDKKLSFKLHVINEMGEENDYSPWSLDWKDANSSSSENLYNARAPAILTGQAKETATLIPNKDECVAADTYEDDLAAAYPSSFEEKKTIRNRISVAEPFIASSCFEMMDLSGSDVKIE